MAGALEFINAPVEGPFSLLASSMVGYRSEGQAPSLHRGVPSPALTLILNLDTPIVTGTHEHAAATGDAVGYDNLVSGLHLRPAYIFQPERQAGIQLALHPLAARRLLGVPAAELTEIAYDAGDVLGNDIDTLRQRVAELPAWPARFEAVRDFLISRDAGAPVKTRPRPEITAAWSWLTEHRGGGRLDDLSRHVSLSARQLTKLFQAELGLSPKAASRLIRFDQARRAVQTRAHGREVSLSQIAHATGHYDHAHLDREFRSFLGCSPSEWLAEEGENIQAGGHQAEAEWAS